MICQSVEWHFDKAFSSHYLPSYGKYRFRINKHMYCICMYFTQYRYIHIDCYRDRLTYRNSYFVTDSARGMMIYFLIMCYNYLQQLCREIIEFLLYRGFPRPIWPAKYHERSEGYFAGQRDPEVK